jgi:glutamate-1-semialdehyde aminotransferase
MSPVATLRFNLPDEQGDFDAARLGHKALTALWDIDQRCRSLLKHGSPTDEEARLAEEIRGMIPGEMLEA